MLAEFVMSPFLQELIITLIVTTIVPFLVQYLRSKAEAAKARAEKDRAEHKQALTDTLASFLLDAAANIAEKRFPGLAKDVVSGRFKDSSQVKSVLYDWGQDLKAEAVKHFKEQDVDLLGQFADETLDRMIETASNNVSPFPGMETAKLIMRKDVSNIIIAKGVDFTKRHIFNIVDGKMIPK